MSDVRDRILLYARLEEVLGAEPAEILVRHMPPNDELLTKTDLRESLAPVTGRMDSLASRMDSLESRMDSLASRMDSLDIRMDSLESRMDSLDIRMERLETRMDGLHTAIHQQTRSFIVSMSTVMASFSAVVIATGILT